MKRKARSVIRARLSLHAASRFLDEYCVSAYIADNTLYRYVLRLPKTMPLYFVVAYDYCFTHDLTVHFADGSTLRAFLTVEFWF